VKKEIKNSHLTYFGNLSDVEKKIFIDRAEKIVSTMPIYNDFVSVLGTVRHSAYIHM
jgi:hypothetical protein